MTWIQIVLVAFLLPWILQTLYFDSDIDVCHQIAGFYCNVSMRCISKFLVCNRYNNCVKGEDESPLACNMDVCHETDRFFCNVSKRCLSKKLVCDGNNDCLNGEDETPPACALKRWCVSKWSSGEGCFGGCKLGYFGKYCEKTCSKECFYGSCNSSSGICAFCTPGYFGKYCQPCSDKCMNRLCNNLSGICKNCKTGYFGKNCEKTCSKECTNGICNRSSGICKNCTPGYFGTYCENTCSKECTNRICNKLSGICKDCARTYLENCSLKCGQGCREKDGFPQCDRQNGICLNRCVLNHYGNYCNVSCMNCKRNSSVVLCDNNGVCLYGCKNGYWDKKCNSKCSTKCEGDANRNRCNSSTGECINGCTRGWSGRFCGDVSIFQTSTTELTDKDNVNSLKTTLIVISAIFTVVVVIVGIICYVWARKRFIRQQNEHMEPGRVFAVGLSPRHNPPGSPRQQHSSLYADINEDATEQYHYICEQNSPGPYDEINVTVYDRDIGILPSKVFTDDSNSLRSVKISKGKLDSSDESISKRSVTQSYSDLNNACNTDNLNGVSVVESNSSIELPAARDSKKGEEIFGDLGQFQVDYIHAMEVNPRRSVVESNSSIELPAARESEKGEELFGDIGQFQVDYIHAIAKEGCDNK